ncbi:MAG: toxin-antitoxin system protein [Bacteroides sp.]|nr:toxin-antitoxin system protein [Bacteroidales bacterium]MBD5325694.1 toxin-antitoxin system protein [Bacteroides sp.]MBD5424742.1 toxin-antitoxin system protein [Bacteroides sp.]
MEATVNRKPTMFRLREELVDKLKQLAARNNRSLNNYVETILMEIAYNTPNELTRKAIAEAQDDSNLTTVSMDSFDSFMQSLELK